MHFKVIFEYLFIKIDHEYKEILVLKIINELPTTKKTGQKEYIFRFP